jgi:hypothetical protein
LNIENRNLADQIAEETALLMKRGRKNYHAMYSASIIAVVSSFLTSLGIASDWLMRELHPFLAALPALALVISDRFKFEDKASWYWGKYYALDDVLSALRYEGMSEAEASKARCQVNKEWEPRWPGFGAAPKK